MKKFFLLTAAVAGVATMANAAEYFPGSTKAFKDGYTLEQIWGAVPDGIAYPAVRTGIGVNDKFYLMDHAAGNVKVYDKSGFVKDINFGGKLWVSCTVDQAGNVIARADKGGWAGPEGAGWYLTENAGFGVIDSKTDEIINKFIAMPGAAKSRFDALSPVLGNILTSEFTALYAPTQGAGNRFEEFGYSMGEWVATSSTIMTLNPLFDNGAAKYNQTLGTVQAFSSEDLAVYGNPHIDVTSSAKGLGNGIAHYKYVITDKGEGWKDTGEFFVTPQHAAMGGFYVFDLAGKQYIVYPAGGDGLPAGDAFAISEVKYTDSPASTEADEEALIARKFAAVMENGAAQYTAKAYYMSFNVVPVENENAVMIYAYNAGCPMSVHKFSVSESAVNEIEIENANAPVEYYNMQGIRVANPENGLFIKRQGAKAEKVVL